MPRRLIATLTSLLLACVGGAQESDSTLASLELLAARAAIEGHMGAVPPGWRVVVDPMIVFAGEAPGGRDSTLRPPGRTAQLADALQGRSESRGSAIDCRVRPCTLRNADILVSLARPAVRGGAARVTVTTVRQSGRGIQYRTVDVLIEKRATGWEVAAIEELGIS